MQHLTHKMLKNIKKILVLLLVAVPFYSVVALPDDRDKTLELSANTADINQQNRHGEYNGHVQLDQGSTHLRATKAITNTDKNNKLLSAVAYGNPKLSDTNPDKFAHYWTQTAIDKPIFHAYAEIIRYYPSRHRIELIGHAHVEQGDNSLAAARIDYDTLEHHVVSASQGKTRTVIVFRPTSSKPNEQTTEKNSVTTTLIQPTDTTVIPSSERKK